MIFLKLTNINALRALCSALLLAIVFAPQVSSAAILNALLTPLEVMVTVRGGVGTSSGETYFVDTNLGSEALFDTPTDSYDDTHAYVEGALGVDITVLQTPGFLSETAVANWFVGSDFYVGYVAAQPEPSIKKPENEQTGIGSIDGRVKLKAGELIGFRGRAGLHENGNKYYFFAGWSRIPWEMEGTFVVDRRDATKQLTEAPQDLVRMPANRLYETDIIMDGYHVGVGYARKFTSYSSGLVEFRYSALESRFEGRQFRTKNEGNTITVPNLEFEIEEFNFTVGLIYTF